MSTIKKLRARISSAHVIAMIALFVALSGSSYAAVSTIRASQIRNNSIPGVKIKKNSIPASRLRNNSISGRKVKNNTLGRRKLRTDALNPTVGGGNLITTNSQSSDDDESSGSSGARGPQGPAGPRGLTGATGPQGPSGQNGATGAAGSDSNLTRVTAGAIADETGTAAAEITCGDGQALYAVNYVTTAPTATATTGAATYRVEISGAAVGVRIDVYGLCSTG